RDTLPRQLFDGFAPRAGYGLIGRDVDALDAHGIVDRLQHDQHLDGRAIRVRDDAARLVLGDRMRVHFGHDERDVVLIAKLGSVVDYDAAGRGGLRRELTRDF